MKIIKLLLLAAVIGIIIWAIPSIGKIFTDADKKNTQVAETDTVAPPPLRKFNDEYQTAWKEQKQWDTALYESHREEAARIATAGHIDKQTYEKALVNLNNFVIARLVSLLETAYKKQEIPEEDVKRNLAGIDTLAKYMPKDRDIAKMQSAWQTYNNIKEFVKKAYTSESFAINLRGSTWTPFDEHKSHVCKKRDAYRENEYYKEYFTNNKELTTGLNSVAEKVEKCRLGYYRRVLNLIKSTYGRVPTFNKDPYFSGMKSAKSELEWQQAKDEFDNAWKKYTSNIQDKRRKLGDINSRFQDQVNDGPLKKAMEDYYKEFKIPDYPKTPDKPTFN